MDDRFFKATNNANYQWIDGDTFLDSDKKAYRLKGYDTREIDKVIGEGTEDSGKLRFVNGHKLGVPQANLVRQFQTQGGFENIVDTGETDDYGRSLVTLTNDKNEDFGEQLIANGIVEVNRYTTEEALQAKREMGMLKEVYGNNVSPYSDLSNNMTRNLMKEGYRSKSLSNTEADYNADLHYGVQYRDEDRTLENKAKGFANQVDASWEMGWDGVKEGLYGYADALGQVTGFEMIETLGEQGVLRAKQRMAEAPQVVSNYRDIGGIKDGFQWAINNAVMSAPYLIGTFGAAAAAIPVAATLGPGAGLAVAVLPMSVTYAGQTWNEMKGEKGVNQFLTASTAGVAMATLDRLGMQSLIPTATLLAPGGVSKLVNAYYLKNKGIKGMTKAIAELDVAQMLKLNQGQFIKSLARMSPDDIAKFSGAQVAKSASLGALTEGGTEILQESLQMAAATFASDTKYSNEAIEDRLINAGLAGSMLGGSISAAGNSYKQGKNQLLGKELQTADVDRQRELDVARLNKINNVGYVKNIEENLKATDSEISRLSDKELKALDGELTQAAARHEDSERGLTNAFKDAKYLKDYLSVIGEGAGKLVKAAERAMINTRRLIGADSAVGFEINALIGQVTTGVYHAGKNFKHYNDSLISRFKSYVDENEIAKNLGGTNIFGKKRTTMNTANAIEISDKIKKFAEKDFNKYLDLQAKPAGYIPTEAEKKFLDDNQKLYEASMNIRNAYQEIYERLKEVDGTIVEDPNFWWQNEGFDYEKVRRDPQGFKNWLRANFDEAQNPDWIQKTYDNIAHRGENSFGKQFSLVGGKGSKHSLFTKEQRRRVNKNSFKQWSSGNIFESLNKAQLEAAKEISTRKYFGEGGSKLDYLFSKLRKEQALYRETNDSALTEKEIDQFAWYAKSIIDSTHGNFNRIETPALAAMNRYLTSWSIFAGLPLSAISSIPETAMIYFNVHNDADYKKATNRLAQQITRAWDKAAEAEVQKTIKSLDRSALTYGQNSIVDRLSTGERDIGFLKAHETFFKVIGIKDITQFQRRMNAGFALDFIKSGLAELDTAPKKKVKLSLIPGNEKSTEMFDQFDVEAFNEVEMRAYVSLTDLGIEVERIHNLIKDLDNIGRDQVFDITDNSPILSNAQDNYLKTVTQRQVTISKLVSPNNETGLKDDLVNEVKKIEAEITEAVETATYRFVNERIQNPQAANRPLFFQDPHYQLMTQFNGFIATFTANIVPKLWNKGLRKGTPQIKYDTFVLILTMIALGGASQMLKDMLKFGEPSPYLDGVGYAQRALYSSGVLGQFERVVDTVAPLYPQRDNGLEWVFNTIVGEAGPSVRLLSNAVTGVGNLAAGEAERGFRNLGKTLPMVAPLTGLRNAGARTLVGKEGFETKKFNPATNEYEDKYSVDNLLF